MALTNVACRHLDLGTCRCNDYANRSTNVPDCVTLTPDNAGELNWMPQTCAYRLLAEGQNLYWWHPLVSGSGESVHQAGISVRGRTVEEKGLTVYDFEDYLVDWPGENPS